MASTLFCVCFSRPLYVSSETIKTQIICSKTSAFSTGSSQMASRIGFTTLADFRKKLYALTLPETTMLTSNESNRAKYIVHQRHHGPLMTPSRHLSETISRYQTIFSSINMVIVGYWVGPDVEDGWGYIDAVVEQNFDL